MTASPTRTSTRLERFYLAKQAEIAALHKKRACQGRPQAYAKARPSLSAALAKTSAAGPLAVMAEYKRASPSRGPICQSVDVAQAALAYAQNGASALSILTEERYFDGRLDFLFQARAALDAAGYEAMPLLRKDFILDEAQVEATAATPASAFLLIGRLTPDAGRLASLRRLGEQYGLEAVVEVFDREDLALARASGAKIIQVNARDLETFQVDRQACLELIAGAGTREGETWIAASGLECRAHLDQAARAGFNAALIGTQLMRRGTPGPDLAALLAGRE